MVLFSIKIYRVGYKRLYGSKDRVGSILFVSRYKTNQWTFIVHINDGRFPVEILDVEDWISDPFGGEEREITESLMDCQI